MKNNYLYLFVIVLGLVLVNVGATAATTGNLIITYPLQGALFPSDFRSPTFRWDDTSSATSWNITCSYPKAIPALNVSIHEKKWRPDPSIWAVMKKHAIDDDLAITITGLSKGQQTSGSVVTIRASVDAVQAPVFYREVPLPVTNALKNLTKIRWRLGWPSEEKAPRVLLEKMEFCANCHSFDRNGTVMGMDADFHGDKGAYVLTDIQPDTQLNDDGVISWSNVNPEPGVKTFGLFAKLSEDGRYVAGTINDIAVYKMLPEISYSQLFFRFRGRLLFMTGWKKNSAFWLELTILNMFRAIRYSVPMGNHWCLLDQNGWIGQFLSSTSWNVGPFIPMIYTGFPFLMPMLSLPFGCWGLPVMG